MQAGKLNKRVTFQEPLHRDTASGGQEEEWGNDLTVWGGFRPDRANEKEGGGRFEATVTGVLRVRGSIKTKAVGEDWRVLIDDEIYSIGGIINPDQRGRELQMTVTRGELV